MTCGEALVSSLVAHGVRHVFGIPGTHNLPIYDHLASSPIAHVTPRHEQGAGYAADGYARASGRPGVCVTTTGPGLTNIVTAAATAYHDSVPLLLISPGMSTTVDGRDTGFLHEVKAQSAALGCIVDWSRRVASAEEATAAVHDAFASFASARPRPVHIEIPLDVLAAPAAPQQLPIAAAAPPEPDAVQVAHAADVLRAARRPCLLLGGGAVAAAGPAVAIAERLGALVLTTVNGKGVVPEDHPLSLGASLRLPLARRLLSEADVVLAVGTELSESDLWVDDLVLGGELVRVDIDERQLQKNAPSRAPVRGDASAVLTHLLELLGGDLAPSRAAGAASLRGRLAHDAARHGAPYERLHCEIARVARDAIVAGDSAMVVYYRSVHQVRPRAPRRFLYPVGYATLGYALPAAIGAKLARPESPVLAIMGDGGCMFSVAELAMAVELRLPIPLIVVDNGGYGEIKAEMLERGATPLGVDLRSPDFPRLAEALGARGVALRDVAELGARLTEAFAADGPTLIAIAESDL
jgi:acetolactate synthase I/II/III large subunit